ncbi:hypothetical protein ACI2L1_23195 [Streptomyces sp. NPDC019531]|uniref:hypothetical protein n=1 Tax=Streptomyces sp. NPDC019531 TaxID=3365062 RepID=UPI003850F6A7
MSLSKQVLLDRIRRDSRQLGLFRLPTMRSQAADTVARAEREGLSCAGFSRRAADGRV